MLPIDPPLVNHYVRSTAIGPMDSKDLSEHIANLVDDMCEAEGDDRAPLARMAKVRRAKVASQGVV